MKSPSPGLTNTLRFHFGLLVTMRDEDILNAVMSVIHGTYTPWIAATRYHVPNKNILQLATILELIQEQQDTNIVDSYNQQQIFICVRNNFNLPSFQSHEYTEWELREAGEIRILDKSSYSDILENVGVPKSTLCRSLNVIFPPLKCSYLKHLWDLILVGKITKKIFREVIQKTGIKTKSIKNLPYQGQRSIHCGNIRNICCTWTPKIYNKPHKQNKKVLHYVGKWIISNEVESKSSQGYSRRLIQCVNREEGSVEVQKRKTRIFMINVLGLRYKRVKQSDTRLDWFMFHKI